MHHFLHISISSQQEGFNIWSKQDTFSLKWTSTYFPNLLLLMLRKVLAFPKDSSKGFAVKTNTTIYMSAKIDTLFQKTYVYSFPKMLGCFFSLFCFCCCCCFVENVLLLLFFKHFLLKLFHYCCCYCIHYTKKICNLQIYEFKKI